MAKFRCKLSGNIFEYFHDFDIKDMMAHPQYTLVEENEDAVQAKVKKTTKEKVKEAK